MHTVKKSIARIPARVIGKRLITYLLGVTEKLSRIQRSEAKRPRFVASLVFDKNNL